MTNAAPKTAKDIRNEEAKFSAGKNCLAMASAKYPNMTRSNHSSALSTEIAATIRQLNLASSGGSVTGRRPSLGIDRPFSGRSSTLHENYTNGGKHHGSPLAVCHLVSKNPDGQDASD